MIIRCDSCDSMFAVPDDGAEDWIEHHLVGHTAGASDTPKL